MRIFVAMVAVLALGAGEVTLPDRAAGAIDGKVALMYWPVSSEGALDPAGCVVHVISDSGRGTEARYRCGEWFVPGPAGPYLAWLEQGDTISASPTIVRYAAEPFRGRGSRSLHQMMPAGFVALAGTPVRGAVTMRLFGVRDGGPHVFERKVPLTEVTSGRSVRMPAGSLIAALYDAAGNPLALARPVRVEAGRQVTVSVREPSSGGAVLLSLQRPSRDYGDGALTLEQNGQRIAPDVVHQLPARVVAMWCAVEAGEAALHFEGEGLPRNAIGIRIDNGKVAMIRENLRE